MCCNNQFDINKIPIVGRWDYDEVSITGGEPLMNHVYRDMFELVYSIKFIGKVQGKSPTMYLYTACFDISLLTVAMECFDGIVLTPHKKEDIKKFLELNDFLIKEKDNYYLHYSCSLRLNLFADMKALLPKDIDLSLWKVKGMEWIENCPVPDGEDFRRIVNLF